jgi:hypothetical protein
MLPGIALPIRWCAKKLAKETSARVLPKNWRELNWKGKQAEGMPIYQCQTK